MSKPRIKIFVSHRIDHDSEIIDNPLYINVRCGAIFDERDTNTIAGLLGDDTGDNISEKRESLGEYTVQYWAWKNEDADYYGLCHYRRYLSFLDSSLPTNQFQGFIVEDKLSQASAKRYNLEKRKMEKEIAKYDIIVSPKYSVSNSPFFPIPKNDIDIWLNHPYVLVLPNHLELLKKLVSERFPQYYSSLLDELADTKHRGFNCFVMKKEFFNQMCEFEYEILFELEKIIGENPYGGNTIRYLAYLGEILYGTYINWVINKKNVKVAEKQIVFYNNTDIIRKPCKSYAYKITKAMMHNILPSYRIGLRIEEQSKRLNSMLQVQNDMIAGINERLRLLEINSRITKIGVDDIKAINKFSFWCTLPKYPSNIAETQQKFWDSYYIKDENIEYIQQANYKLLKELKKYCDILNIKFWLHGGSLVGALRHNGYVPWDDDIDIAMMRKDLNKLIALLQNTNYVIANYYYPRLGCRCYRFMPKNSAGLFFVDIFTYDYHKLETDSVTDDWEKLKRFKIKMIMQMGDIVKKYGIVGNNICIDEYPEAKKEIDLLVDTYVERFESSTEEEYLAWGMDNNFEDATKYVWHHGQIYRTDSIFPLKVVRFIDEVLYAPADYESYVISQYGIGYLELPNDIGKPKHVEVYFSGKSVKQCYEEFILTMKEDSGDMTQGE